MKKIPFVVVLMLAIACNNTPPSEDGTQGVPGNAAKTQTPAPENGLITFKAEPVKKGEEVVDMCKEKFEEGIPLMPAANNPDMRLFDFSKDGTYVVSVNAGNTHTTFMLRSKGQQVAVLTSNEYPYCLSNIASFHPYNSGDGFRYDADRYTKFDFKVIPNGAAFRGELSWDKGKVYGIFVRKKLD